MIRRRRVSEQAFKRALLHELSYALLRSNCALTGCPQKQTASKPVLVRFCIVSCITAPHFGHLQYPSKLFPARPGARTSIKVLAISNLASLDYIPEEKVVRRIVCNKRRQNLWTPVFYERKHGCRLLAGTDISAGTCTRSWGQRQGDGISSAAKGPLIFLIAGRTRR